MEIRALNCNNCGAQLDVPNVANFVTCGFCNSNLAIRHTDTLWYTEKIDAIAATTSEIGEQLARIEYRDALERIDAEWELERASLQEHSKLGKGMSARDRKIAYSSIALAGLFVAGWGIIVGEPGTLITIGLAVTVVALCGYIGDNRAEAKFEQAHNAYLRRRGGVRIDDFRPKSSLRE